MPKEDRKKIRDFFYHLLSLGFGYTLFGDKPLSFENYKGNSSELSATQLFYSSSELILKEGWQAWKKSISLFPSENFLITQQNSSTREGDLEIMLINKEACKAILIENIALFRKQLHCDLSAEELLVRLCQEDDLVGKEMLSHPLLLGILLGYGTTNSQMFQRKWEIADYLRQELVIPRQLPKEWEKLDPFLQDYLSNREEPIGQNKKEKARVSEKFSSLWEELVYLSENSRFFQENQNHPYIECIGLPTFICLKNDAETEKLREKYEATRSKVTKVLQNPLFLEIIITQWLAIRYEKAP